MVVLRYSGGPSNQFGIASIGGAMSSFAIPDATLNNLWDNVTRVEVINGRTEYRCFFILNNEATNFLKVRTINLVVPADTELSFAVSEVDTQQLLITEDSTPVGLAFFDVADWLKFKIPIGTLDINGKIAIWMKRKVTAGSDAVRTISMVIDGIDNTITFSQDFGSVENSHDNINIKNRSSLFYTDLDFCGEALFN